MKESLAKIRKSAHSSLPQSSLEIATLIAEGCTDAKGSEVTALNVSGLSDIADYFVIVSGRSDRQTQGIVNRAIETAMDSGINPMTVEGYDRGHWILVDFGEVVLHVFYGPMREHFNIEALWSRATRVDLKKRRKDAAHSGAPTRNRSASLRAA